MIKVTSQLIVLAFLFLTSGCAQKIAPTTITFPDDTGQVRLATREGSLSVGLWKQYDEDGQRGFRLTVSISESGSNMPSTLAILDPETTRLVAQNVRGAPPSAVFKLGVQVASQTMCQGMKITRNTSDRRISDPAAIAKILAANQGKLFPDTMPAGLRGKGQPLPAAELSHIGVWKVNLWCK